jgi:ABC-type uncharacterized transport system permease subunit
MKNSSHNLEAAHEGSRAILPGAQFLTRQAHPDWIYFLPILHFCACLMSTLRYFIPGLQYLVVICDFVMHADFPISLLAYALTPKYAPLAAIWIVVAGTLWWYLLSRAAEALFNKFTPRQKPRPS